MIKATVMHAQLFGVEKEGSKDKLLQSLSKMTRFYLHLECWDENDILEIK